MSSRTAHSFAGMRRYLQISKDRIFMFVEGRDLDPYIYGRICSPVCRAAGKAYEIVVADRLTRGAGGGKDVLTGFFEYLRDNGSLLDVSQPLAKLSMFFLDKDVDDVFRALRPSAHVVYTYYYNIENHLFSEGKLVSSIANAGSVDTNLIEPRIGDPEAWRKDAATLWRDWVVLCLLARKLSLGVPVGYGMKSTINDPVDAPVDAVGLSTLIGSMESKSGLGTLVFRRKLAATYRFVDAVYARSGHDLLFKGKWYSAFALRDLEVAAPLHNKNGAADRLFGALVASIDYDGGWVERFRQPLRDALALLP